MASQQEMDFHRGDQLGMLEACSPPSVRLSPSVTVKGSTLKLVLRAIDGFARGRACFADQSTIAQRCSLHVATVRRAIRALEGLQVLACDRRYNQRIQATMNYYSIVWPELARYSSPARMEASKEVPTPPTGGETNRAMTTASAQWLPTNRAMATDQSRNGYFPSLYESNKNRSLSPSIPQGDGEWGVSDRDDPCEAERWKAVESAIVRAGVREWVSVCECLRQRVTSEHALSILSIHFQRKGAYGPVALLYRLRRAHPDLSPELGWPKPIANSPWVLSERVRRKVRKEAQATRDAGKEVTEGQVLRCIADRLRKQELVDVMLPEEHESLRSFLQEGSARG